MARLAVKAGVQPRLVHLLVAVANVAQRTTSVSEVVITSGIDGVHSPNSLHYALRAIDIRSYNFPNAAALGDFAQELKAELGPSYDIVIEADHIHVEFDPR